MQQSFDALVTSYLDTQVGMVDGFLDKALAQHLRGDLLAMYDQRRFHAAGIGNDVLQNHDTQLRGDEIFWLDRSHDNASELAFYKVMDAFVEFLNQTCYTGITDYEFHFAKYEKGSFYKRHYDQFRSDSSRAYTMIMYLNEDWKPADGGELCIHHAASEAQIIAPMSGRCVFFKSSDILHEVMLTQVPRLSITGWLKR